MEAWVGGMIGGAVGAVIGHAANHFIGWFKESRQSSPERKFICAELVFLLEDYASKCADVAQDDGEPIGPHGEYRSITSRPEPIDHSMVKGNWRALSSDVMYDVCSIAPLQREALEKIVSADENSTPPDNDEYFRERQLQFSMLGLKAANLAIRIRKENNFPDSRLYKWVIPTMQTKKSSIAAKRKKYSDDDDYDI